MKILCMVIIIMDICHYMFVKTIERITTRDWCHERSPELIVGLRRGEELGCNVHSLQP